MIYLFPSSGEERGLCHPNRRKPARHADTHEEIPDSSGRPPPHIQLNQLDGIVQDVGGVDTDLLAQVRLEVLRRRIMK